MFCITKIAENTSDSKTTSKQNIQIGCYLGNSKLYYEFLFHLHKKPLPA